MYSHLRKTTFLILASILALNGCGFRSSHPVKMRTSTATLKDATLDQLVESINTNAGKLKTFKASVDIDSSMLDQKKDKVIDKPQVPGWVLMRKPESLRMIGLLPLVHTHAFDMVSDGKTFSLAIPPKNRFYVGSNRQPNKPSAAPSFEDLRPQHISDALLLKPIDPEKELAVLEQTTEIVKDPKSHKDAEQQAYAVLVIDKDANGAFLSRRIVFSRTDLQPHEQAIYDRQGRLVTFARYENFGEYSGISFPAIVSIQRPIEGLGMTLSIVKLDVNVPLTDEQFVLTQPPGSQLINVDTQAAAAITDEKHKKPPQR